MRTICTHSQGKSRAKGFSLIEMLIAVALSLILMSGIYAYCNSHHKSHNVQTRINEMNQNIRVSMNKMVSEIRMAGFKMDSGTKVFHATVPTATWTAGLVPTVPYAQVMNDNLVIRQGAYDPLDDMITFIYADTDPNIVLVQAVAISAVWLKLNLTAAQVAARFHLGDIIYIGFGVDPLPGSLEFGKVAENPTSQWLYVDFDPQKAGVNGLESPQGYRAGTSVGIVNVVTYAVFTDENDPSCLYHDKGHPVLKRKCNKGSYETFVEDIESLEVTAQGTDVQISIIARTSKEEKEYTDPEFDDHYRHRTLTSMVKVRNRE